jgi:hypothetical protein
MPGSLRLPGIMLEKDAFHKKRPLRNCSGLFMLQKIRL